MLGDAHAQAEAIAAKYRSQAATEDADLLVRSQKAAEEREERLVSAAQMEARKSLLTVKQEMVEQAYQRALEKLRTLPKEQYVDLLAAMLVRASSTGKEEVVFSPEDREEAGRAAVSRANDLRARAVALVNESKGYISLETARKHKVPLQLEDDTETEDDGW